MSVQPMPSHTWPDRLQRIDRRILYLILILVVAVPILYPVRMPNAVSPMSRSLWDSIAETPKGKVVLLCSDWTNATRGENGGQFRAVVEQLMSLHIPFLLCSFDPAAAQIALTMIRSMAPHYDYVYGRDWLSLGYQASPNNFVKGIDADFRETVKRDEVEKKPLDTFPIMRHVRSIDDVHIVVEFSAASTQQIWIQFLKPGIKIGFACTSVMAPEALPYYAAGQLAGVLWGAKGAYDYEQLNVEHHTGTYGLGQRYMSPLSAAFALVILSIVVGNVAMFASRRRAARGGGR